MRLDLVIGIRVEIRIIPIPIIELYFRIQDRENRLVAHVASSSWFARAVVVSCVRDVECLSNTHRRLAYHGKRGPDAYLFGTPPTHASSAESAVVPASSPPKRLAAAHTLARFLVRYPDSRYPMIHLSPTGFVEIFNFRSTSAFTIYQRYRRRSWRKR